MNVALLAGVVGASLVGSLHCVAMCGPLVGLHGGAKTMRFAISHSLGRLATYVALGTAAGLIGSAIDLAGKLGNVQRAATILAAGMIVIVGVVQIVQLARPGRPARSRPTEQTMFARTLVRIRPRGAARRSFLIGTLTGLLPCGWLWAFVIAAAGTGSVIAGALTMFAFWIGTVPAMVGVLAFAGPLVARLRARVPAITAVAMIAIGLGTLAMRWRDVGAQQVSAPHCHHHRSAS